MAIATNLQRLVSAKSAIADAIVSKGGSVGADDGFEAFPAAIDAISAGGYNFDITQDEWDTIVAINNQTISGTLSMSGATEIGNCMFQECSSLEEVNFPDCIKIGNSAFERCTSLQSVNFPACISIGFYAFYSCSSLQSVSFPVCTTIDGYAFQSCSSLQSANFPACILVGYSAFYRCTLLQSVNFPDCIKIGSSAFNRCTSLQSVSFPVCTSIGSNAFENCSSLQSANFPACTSIGSNAFRYCNKLSAIYLLASTVCTLVNKNVFQSTPMSLSTYLGYFGSIYVPSSLVASYKTATNWTDYANRIVGV